MKTLNYKAIQKKIIKNKLNIAPLLLILVAVISIYFLNYQTITYYDLTNNLEQEQNELKKNIENFRISLSSTNIEESNRAQKDIEIAESLLNSNQNIITELNKNNYKEAYQLMVESINFDHSVIKEHPELYGNNYDNLITAIERDKAYYEYLSTHDIKGDNKLPTMSLTYSVSIWNEYLPILLALASIFILCQCYSQDFYNRLMIYRLNPEGYFFKSFAEIFSGYIFLIVIFISTLVFSYIFAFIFKGNASFDYPILTYNQNDELSWSPIRNILLPSFLLQGSSLLALVTSVYFFTYLLRDKLLSIFFNMTLILGSMILTYFLVPFQEVAHLNPFNYLQSVAIVTGQFNQSIPINQLSFGLGIKVTILYTLILLILINILHSARTKKYLNV